MNHFESSRTLALAAQSIPAPLVALATDVVRETHALAVVEATIRGDFEHDPDDTCGCDRCVLTREELNAHCDARRDEVQEAQAGDLYADDVHDGALPWEVGWEPPVAGLYGAAQLFRGWVCLAGDVPVNSAVDPGEAA